MACFSLNCGMWSPLGPNIFKFHTTMLSACETGFCRVRVRGIKKTSFNSFNSPLRFVDAVFLESKSHMFVDWSFFSEIPKVVMFSFWGFLEVFNYQALAILWANPKRRVGEIEIPPFTLGFLISITVLDIQTVKKVVKCQIWITTWPCDFQDFGGSKLTLLI